MDELHSETLGDSAVNVKQIGPKPTVNHYSGADFKTYKEWVSDVLLSLKTPEQRVSFLQMYFDVPLQRPTVQKPPVPKN